MTNGGSGASLLAMKWADKIGTALGALAVVPGTLSGIIIIVAFT